MLMKLTSGVNFMCTFYVPTSQKCKKYSQAVSLFSTFGIFMHKNMCVNMLVKSTPVCQISSAIWWSNLDNLLHTIRFCKIIPLDGRTNAAKIDEKLGFNYFHEFRNLHMASSIYYTFLWVQFCSRKARRKEDVLIVCHLEMSIFKPGIEPCCQTLLQSLIQRLGNHLN